MHQHMPFHWHLVWVWFWFLFGMFIYMLKRAYYLVTGPNPVATNYPEFIQRCWIPLLVRAVVDSSIYWLTFYPDVFNDLLNRVGISWQMHSPLPEMGVVALIAGMSVDSIVDFAVSKVPYVKDWLPQMPAPLGKVAVDAPKQ